MEPVKGKNLLSRIFMESLFNDVSNLTTFSLVEDDVDKNLLTVFHYKTGK
jgi:hypothetical protein